MSPFMSWARHRLLGVMAGLMVLMATAAHAGSVTYVYTDPQGTPLAEADASGNITATYDYAPYGSQALGTPPSGPGYTGHVNDPDTGLVYMQARYYDPAVGRFISTDPVGPAVGNTFNFSRYAYANNNPVVNTDPDGRCTGTLFCETGSGARVPGVIGAGYTTLVNPHENDGGGSTRKPGAGARSASGGTSGQVGDALMSILGVAGNEMKRPNNPTKIPDKLAHELFMVNASGVALAASPGAIVVGASAAPVTADAGTAVAIGAGRIAVQYAPRAAMIGCLSISCRDPENLPDQYVQDRAVLQELYEGSKTAASELFKAVFVSDPK